MPDNLPEDSRRVMDDDDRTVGHIYTRRRALLMLGAAGGALVMTGCSSSDPTASATDGTSVVPGCVVRPALTEGPIFVDDQANRSDIRTDPTTGAVSQGATLDLTFRVSTLNESACAPLAGAQVDLWHCDAEGIYSDTDYENMGTVGQKFLRGHQFTDGQGVCSFTTIYPGWYETRAVHLHFKIRTDDGHEFTSQLFFDPALTDKVFAAEPYSARGERTVRNEDDGIFAQSGEQMTLAVTETSDGYAAEFEVALDM